MKLLDADALEVLLTKIDRLIVKGFKGSTAKLESHWDPSLLLVAYAICSNVDNTSTHWQVCSAAAEAYDATEAVQSAKEAVMKGTYDGSESTFSLLKDAWALYVACEAGTSDRRCFCVEILDPYEIGDPGAILGVSRIRACPPLRLSATKWVIDLEALTATELKE